ncbi:MAG: hypothetical protein JSV00_06620 [bacterium]|nr:MAG: hypothetical protein JSV00_06620 [bacterium]
MLSVEHATKGVNQYFKGRGESAVQFLSRDIPGEVICTGVMTDRISHEVIFLDKRYLIGSTALNLMMKPDVEIIRARQGVYQGRHQNDPHSASPRARVAASKGLICR